MPVPSSKSSKAKPQQKKAETATPEVGYKPPPEGYLNYSQLLDWLKCRYRWDLGYTRRIQSRAPQRALDVGSAVHYGIRMALLLHSTAKKWKSSMMADLKEAARQGVERWLADTLKSRGGRALLTEEERLLVVEIETVAYSVVARSIDYLRPGRFRAVRLDGKPLIEHSLTSEFDSPNTGWKGVHCTPDYVADDLEKGGRWILDYKVRQQYTPPDAEDVNLQFPFYQKVLADHGLPTVGTVMFQIKSAAFSTPKVNKDGSMSRADIFCDWETYRKALLAAGLRPEDYVEMQDKLKNKEPFREDRVYRGEAEVGWIWHDIIERAAAAMTREAPFVFRTMHHMNCNGCWARRFCMAELSNEDTELLLKTDYVDTKNPAQRLILDPAHVDFTD